MSESSTRSCTPSTVGTPSEHTVASAPLSHATIIFCNTRSATLLASFFPPASVATSALYTASVIFSSRNTCGVPSRLIMVVMGLLFITQNLRPSGDFCLRVVCDGLLLGLLRLFADRTRSPQGHYRCGTVRESHPTSTNNRTCIVFPLAKRAKWITHHEIFTLEVNAIFWGTIYIATLSQNLGV